MQLHTTTDYSMEVFKKVAHLNLVYPFILGFLYFQTQM